MTQLTLLIQQLEEQKNTTTSQKHLTRLYIQYIDKIAHLLHLNKKHVHHIKKSLHTTYLLNKIQEKNPQLFPKNDSTTNYYCYITGKTTNTTTFRIHNILPEPILDWLANKILPEPPFPLPLWAIIIIMTTAYPIYLLTNFIIPTLSALAPANIMTVLTLGTTWTASDGYVYTNGINGIKQWSSPLYGCIGREQDLYQNLPAAFFPAILGFIGIKLNLGDVHGAFYLMRTQYYFGTALAVGIQHTPF